MSVIVSHVYLLNGKRLGVLEQSFLSKYQLIKHSNEKSYNYSWLYLIKRNNFMLYLYISKQIRELENTQEWVPTKESLWSFLALSCHQKAVKLPGTNPPQDILDQERTSAMQMRPDFSSLDTLSLRFLPSGKSRSRTWWDTEASEDRCPKERWASYWPSLTFFSASQHFSLQVIHRSLQNNGTLRFLNSQASIRNSCLWSWLLAPLQTAGSECATIPLLVPGLTPQKQGLEGNKELLFQHFHLSWC